MTQQTIPGPVVRITAPGSRCPDGRLGLAALLAVAALTLACGRSDGVSGSGPCEANVTPSDPASLSLAEAGGRVDFAVAYPCRLPPQARLRTIVVDAAPAGQKAHRLTLVFEAGEKAPITLSEASQSAGFFAPPSGATVSDIDLGGATGKLIEADSERYYLLLLAWDRDGVHYELQTARGKGTTRDTLIEMARSVR